ncbi:MAG: hypothetical protein PVF69_10830, partial [Gemmatimonadota bacterium]
MSRPLPLLVAILALVPAGLVAQNEAPDGPVMPLLTDVTGDFSRPIDTESTLAQAYFDQGMQMV